MDHMDEDATAHWVWK